VTALDAAAHGMAAALETAGGNQLIRWVSVSGFQHGTAAGSLPELDVKGLDLAGREPGPRVPRGLGDRSQSSGGGEFIPFLARGDEDPGGARDRDVVFDAGRRRPESRDSRSRSRSSLPGTWTRRIARVLGSSGGCRRKHPMSRFTPGRVPAGQRPR
jgi:hypothetical protein